MNADLIARGLSPLDVDAAALKAGILMMKELRRFAGKGADFGTESTLSARTYAPLIDQWKSEGYLFHLFYIWLPNADMAVERVAARVRAGGHNIPTEVLRRRYDRGLKNLKETYLPRADVWTILDNSGPSYRVVACGRGEQKEVFQPEIWEQIDA
ncbi:Zeta toxin family protein [bacterium]|nr:MAG: Zeta toxin family protein [bacterium]